MSNDRAYRVLVAFDSESSLFVARVPELGIECRAISRAEAVTESEQALEQRIAGALEDKETLPEPIDAWSGAGDLTLAVPGPMYRDLKFYARVSGMAVEQLAGHLLARALGELDAGRLVTKPQNQNHNHQNHNHQNHSGRNYRREREGLRPELDDKANFLEYLRGLEKSGGPGRGRR